MTKKDWVQTVGVAVCGVAVAAFMIYKEATAIGEPLSPKAWWQVVMIATVVAGLSDRAPSKRLP